MIVNELSYKWFVLMIALLRRVIKNQYGASVVELTMIMSLIAVAAIASIRSVSSKVSMVLGSLN